MVSGHELGRRLPGKPACSHADDLRLGEMLPDRRTAANIEAALTHRLDESRAGRASPRHAPQFRMDRPDAYDMYRFSIQPILRLLSRMVCVHWALEMSHH